MEDRGMGERKGRRRKDVSKGGSKQWRKKKEKKSVQRKRK